ncbi:MAG: TRAP transporter small permease [Chloroflexi bacterium]|nr:TRAP transporter small permease [Chloroflexota bacterium]
MAGVMFMMLLTTADVAGRYFLDRPIMGAVELQENMIVVVVLLGLAASQRLGLQVSVDLVYSWVKGRSAHGLRLFWLLVLLLLFGLVTVSGVNFFLEDVAKGAYAGNILRIPRAPFSFTVPLGSFLLCLRVVLQMKEEGASLIRGKGS